MLSKVAIFNSKEGVFSIENETIKEKLEQDEVLVKQVSVAMIDLDLVEGTKHGIKTLGRAACCEVEKVGEVVTWLARGDRVVYFTEPGAFRQYRVIKQEKLCKVPSQISSNAAATLLYFGCIAHMAAARAFIVRGGVNALIENIHSPIASAIGWLAKQRGARVIGLSAEKISTPDVCDFVINPSAEDITKAVFDATKGIGCHVYYSGLNPLSLGKIVDCLTLSGVIVDHLNVFENLQNDLIAKKSLFFTTPSLLHYKEIRSELVLTIDEIFAINEKVPLQLEVVDYSLDRINEAFNEISLNKTSKAVIVKPF